MDLARLKVLVIIAIMSGFAWIFYDREGETVSFSQYREMQHETPAIMHVTPPPSSQKKPQALAPAPTEDFNHQLDEAMVLAEEANKRCLFAFRKLLPNSKWPTPSGSAYPQVADLRALLNVGLNPSLAKQDHQVIRVLGAELASEHPMLPERVQKLLRTFWELESCRGRDAGTLIDAILELARKNKSLKQYQDSDVRALVAQIWQALVLAQQGYYTPTDLTFLVGYWQKAQAQGLIGETHRGDLVALAEKIMSAINEEEALLPSSGLSLSSQKLRDFYREIQTLGHDLEEFGKDVLASEG